MTKVVVTGMGVISSLGSTLDQTWEHLLAGESGIGIYQPFPKIPPQPLALIGCQPSDIDTLLLQAVSAACQDAALPTALDNCGVVIGSSRGSQAQWEQQVREDPDTVHTHPHDRALLVSAGIKRLYGTSPATVVAQYLGACGPLFAPRAACATGIWAIAQGAELIRDGYCSRVVVGAVEAPVTPLTLAGFKKMGALAQSGAYPFDHRRQGFVLGEGAAILILETEVLAQQRHAHIYGQVLSMGLTVDAYHMTAPDKSRQWAMVAVNDCLRRSGLQTSDIGYIHAHGTATHLNDRAEASVIETLFPPTVAISSSKGAIGHTLGASAALGSVFCLMALSQNVLPPCVGLQNPAFNLNFVREPIECNSQAALCFSFGFGGQNTVLALATMDCV